MRVWAVYDEDSSDWPDLFTTEEKAKDYRDRMAACDPPGEERGWKIKCLRVS